MNRINEKLFLQRDSEYKIRLIVDSNLEYVYENYEPTTKDDDITDSSVFYFYDENKNEYVIVIIFDKEDEDDDFIVTQSNLVNLLVHLVDDLEKDIKYKKSTTISTLFLQASVLIRDSIYKDSFSEKQKQSALKL